MGQHDPTRTRPTPARLLWLVLALALASSAALAGAVLAVDDDGPPAQAAACAQFDVSGTWTTHQANGYDPTFSFQQSGTRLSGSATLPGDQAGRAGFASNTGGVSGSMEGRDIDVTVTWSKSDGSSVSGRYTGRISASSPGRGTLSGDAGGYAWTGSGPAKCTQSDDPCPASSSSATAFAAETCETGYGNVFTMPAPPDVSISVGPEADVPRKATALEVFLALQQLQAEEEAEYLAEVMVLELRDPKYREVFEGCLLFVQALGTDDEDDSYARAFAVTRACRQLALKANNSSGARIAASGCKAVFWPVFGKNEKVTKRRVMRARAVAQQQLAASCTSRPEKLTASLRAREGRKIRALTGKRVRAFAARRQPKGAPDRKRELSVRWRARKG